MKEWLLKTMKQNYEILMHFERALGNHHFMADSVNVFAALIRNVVAYAYLIGQVLAGNLGCSAVYLIFFCGERFYKLGAGNYGKCGTDQAVRRWNSLM